jgi:PleD family two-component response regulator
MQQKICLLIDDDKDDQEFFNHALQKVSPNTRLVVAGDAMEAVKLLREEIPPDYIFLDLYLPGIDGYEFLLQLKRDIKHRRIPVIIYSTLDDPAQITRTKKLGASDFFTKTYKLYELENLLRKYVQQS